MAENTDTTREPERSKSLAIENLRRITDPQALKALAHPVRVALYELLSLEGSLTATEAGERIGESATTCSFHLRQLAKYGYVEEAGGGKGRARPWRAVDEGFSISAERDDPESAVAASALGNMLLERNLGRLREWRASRERYPDEWRHAATSSEMVTWLTPSELSALNSEVLELIYTRFRERRTDPSQRPDGALPVETLLFNYPMTPPGGGR